jgi:hypothetical protein
MPVKIRSANRKRGLTAHGAGMPGSTLRKPKKRPVLGAGLKYSKTGGVVRDRRVARVAKRKTAQKLGIGPYRPRRKK